MSRVQVALLALLSLPSSADGQFVGGRVSHFGAGRPAAGVSVIAVQDKHDRATAVTDSAGAFYLGPLKPGVYRLRIGDGTAAPFSSDTMRVTKDDFVQRDFLLDTTAQRVYYDFEVAKTTAPFPGNRAPRYPPALKDRHVSGKVLARFVVDTTGYVMDGSFSVLSASDSGFVNSVAEAVQGLGFFPAELSNGRKVRQLVRMPFQFDIW